MYDKSLIFSHEEIRSISHQFGTPIHVYDAKTIIDRLTLLDRSFHWAPGFKNYYAVKALPNPSIIKLIADNGGNLDCSSLSELILADALGISGDRVMLTSNNTSLKTYQKAYQMNAIINVDDISHIAFLEENNLLPDRICFRFNPGASRSGNVIIGHPEDAKFGLTHAQIIQAYKTCVNKGIKRFGLHTMVVSNCLDIAELALTARMVFELALEILKETGVKLDFINLGGGIGVAYKPEEKPVDFEELGASIEQVYNELVRSTPLHPLRLMYENGRTITGPAGFLVTRVRHQKDIYKKYLGVDAGIHCLMRPALYDSYHHITVVKDTPTPGLPLTRSIFTSDDKTAYDVVGSLCENNDKLCKNRVLGSVSIGDILVFHDTGAHGHAMGFNYNGCLRPAEVLKDENGKYVRIRREETIEDLYRTVENWPLGSRGAIIKKNCTLYISCVVAVGLVLGAFLGRHRSYFFSR